jgi:ketosteroid isomerase-like protein
MHTGRALTAVLFIVMMATPLLAQDAATEKTLIANERAVMDAFAKGNRATVEKFLARDGFAIDPMMGPMTNAETLKTFDQMVKDMKITSWAISNEKVVWADPTTAILSYTWTGKGTMQGQPIPSPTFASTVWTKRGGNWMAVFHQETSKVAVPAPAPAKKN